MHMTLHELNVYEQGAAQANMAAVQQGFSLDILRHRNLALVGAVVSLVLAREATVNTEPVYAQDQQAQMAPPVIDCPPGVPAAPTGFDGQPMWICAPNAPAPPATPPAAETPAASTPAPAAETPATPATPAAPKPVADPKPAHEKTKAKPHKHKKAKSEGVYSDSQESFPGYDMGARAFTARVGCFITSASSAFRRLTGRASLTPEKLYNQDTKHKDIKTQWKPVSGVIKGNLFDSLPAMAKRLHATAKPATPEQVKKAMRSGDGSQAMVLFKSGYFAGPKGHYMAVLKVLPNGNEVLDDPNGNGKHHDSERPEGWSPQALSQRGAIAYRLIRRLVSRKG